MKFISSVLLTALLSAIAAFYMPWWSVAIVCFLVSLVVVQSRGRAFLMGFLAEAGFWFVAVTIKDVANEHILSERMAELFQLPNYGAFIAVNVLIGGIVGGISAWVASLMRKKF